MWAGIARYIQHVTGGDVTREPLQVFANTAQIVGTILAFVALVLAIWGVLTALRTLRVTSAALGVANTSLAEDRQERRAIRDEHRRTLWTALRLDVGIIEELTSADLQRFREPDEATPDQPRDMQQPFVWTPLPVETIQQAIYEAAHLDLRQDDIEALQQFRNRIVRVNANVRAYFVMSWVGATGAAGQGVTQLTRAHNERIRVQFEDIVAVCQDVTARFQARWSEEARHS
jgi:hypothetical protein